MPKRGHIFVRKPKPIPRRHVTDCIILFDEDDKKGAEYAIAVLGHLEYRNLSSNEELDGGSQEKKNARKGILIVTSDAPRDHIYAAIACVNARANQLVHYRKMGREAPDPDSSWARLKSELPKRRVSEEVWQDLAAVGHHQTDWALRGF